MSHPVHPALVHFPIACWVLGSLVDISNVVFGLHRAEIAALLISAGLVLAVPAMIAGLLEMIKIEQDTVAQKVAEKHMNLVLMSWLFYAVSLYLRVSNENSESVSLVVLACSMGGVLSLGFAGWYGGQLVYEYRIGVKK